MKWMRQITKLRDPQERQARRDLDDVLKRSTRKAEESQRQSDRQRKGWWS